MLKRTWSLLLVIALFAAPGAAFAAGPGRATADRGPSLMQQVWEGLLRFIDLDGEDFGERSQTIRGPEEPRNVYGADDTGGHIDPGG